MKMIFLLIVLCLATGCSSMTKQEKLRALSNGKLYWAFSDNRNWWGWPDMDYVREIHRRGGFTDNTLARFEAGEKRPDGIDEVAVAWGTTDPVRSGNPRSIHVYSRSGRTSVTPLGAGTFSVRRSRGGFHR